MTEQVTLFRWDDSATPRPLTEPERDYLALGVPKNPFVDAEGVDAHQRPVLYGDHIRPELNRMQDWVNLAYAQAPKPLSLVGGIGLGKTHLLRYWERLLLSRAEALKIAVLRVSLYDYGAQRASLGQLMLRKLQEWTAFGGEAHALPEGVELIPLIWQMAQARAPEEAPQSLMGRHIRSICALEGDAREERARLLSRWLGGAELTARERRALGEPRRIDPEGELLTYLCDLVGVAERLGVCKRVYFMVDQLEDLFRSNVSQVRRSRLLTDLRHLIDAVSDKRAPIALMVAWTTEVEENGRSKAIEERFNSAYPALMDRMRSGELIRLALLRGEDRAAFARAYIDALSNMQGYDLRRVTERHHALVARASALASAEGIHEGSISPRRWLSCLARAMDALAAEAARA